MLIALVLLAAPAGAADLYLRQVMEVEPFAIMGQTQPGRTDTLDVWVSSHAARVRTGGSTDFLIDTRKGALFIVDRENRTWTRVPLRFDKMDLLLAAGLDSTMAAATLAQMKGKMTVERTEQTKVLDSHKTRLYRLAFESPALKATTEMWVDEDFKDDPGALRDMVNAFIRLGAAMIENAEVLDEIHGLPMLTTQTTEMMGATIRATKRVIAIETGKAPLGTYEVPADFTEAPLDLRKLQAQ